MCAVNMYVRARCLARTSCRAAVSCIFTLVFIVFAGKLAELIVRISACLACTGAFGGVCSFFFLFLFLWRGAMLVVVVVAVIVVIILAPLATAVCFRVGCSTTGVLVIVVFCCYTRLRCSRSSTALVVAGARSLARLLTLAWLACFVLVCLLTRLIAC